jgi:hypothetical protein
VEPPAGYYKQRFTYFACPSCGCSASCGFAKAGETMPRYWCPNCKKFSVLANWVSVWLARVLVFPLSFAFWAWGPFASYFYGGGHFWLLVAVSFLLAFALSPLVARLVCRYKPATNVP